MQADRQGRWQQAATAVGAALALFVAARMAPAAPVAMTIAGLGPASGLLAGGLLGWGQRSAQAAALIGGALLGLFAALALRADLLALVGGLAAVGGGGVAAFALLRARGLAGPRDPFTRPAGVLWLLWAAGLAALLPAALAATAGWRQAGIAYGAHLLGILLVVPAIAAVARLGRQPRWPDGWHAAEAVLLLGGAAALSGVAFARDGLGALFLLSPLLLLIAARLRTVGSALALPLVAAVALAATARGHGPIAAAMPADWAPLLESFLLGGFLVGLPVAALLADRDRRGADVRTRADRLRRVVDGIGEVIFLVDADGRWAFLNPAWEQLTGLSPAASLGRPWIERIAACDRDGIADRVAPLFAGESGAVRETLRFAASGGIRWVELFIDPVRDAAGRPAGAAGTLRDVDERKRQEEHSLSARRAAEQRAQEATLLASTDELTGIANRRAFLGQLDREVEAAIEYGWSLAVALFDVDHFKAVNDRYGHAVGDRVLQRLATRAVGCVRGGDLVGRLGGEEFAILMPGASAAEAAIVAERLRRAVALPDEAGSPPVTVSIGIAQHDHQTAGEALLAAADQALYRAKDKGRNRVVVAA